jgi:hypothetical protein
VGILLTVAILRELVFEILLSGRHLPKEVLDNGQVLHLLRFDTEGYLMICKMPESVWVEKRKSFPTGGPRKLVVKPLPNQAGDSVLLKVSGLWLGEDEKRQPEKSKTFGFYKSLEKLPLYPLKPPTISGNSIRLAAVAENSEIKQLLSRLKEMGIAFKVIKLDNFEASNDSPLLQLTLQQLRILRLAQTLGYYDIPRKTNTEDLARIVGMDKGTVGEHLRRAEKHVFEDLLSS